MVPQQDGKLRALVVCTWQMALTWMSFSHSLCLPGVMHLPIGKTCTLATRSVLTCVPACMACMACHVTSSGHASLGLSPLCRHVSAGTCSFPLVMAFLPAPGVAVTIFQSTHLSPFWLAHFESLMPQSQKLSACWLIKGQWFPNLLFFQTSALKPKH